MTPPLIENTVEGPPPLRRAVAGLLLGLLVGALAAAALPRRERPWPGLLPDARDTF